MKWTTSSAQVVHKLQSQIQIQTAWLRTLCPSSPLGMVKRTIFIFHPPEIRRCLDSSGLRFFTPHHITQRDTYLHPCFNFARHEIRGPAAWPQLHLSWTRAFILWLWNPREGDYKTVTRGLIISASTVLSHLPVSAAQHTASLHTEAHTDAKVPNTPLFSQGILILSNSNECY